MSRDSPLLHGALNEVKLLLYRYTIAILHNLHYSLLPNKYLDLNQTKAIAGVSGLGPYSLYNYYTNAHPLYGTIIKSEKL